MIPLPSSLIARKLIDDPRLEQAKRLVAEALREHQEHITTIRAPDPLLVQPYEELLNDFMECRGAKLYFPFIGSGMGNGSLVELFDGSVKYDMISGIGSHFWGHHHGDILKVNMDAAISDTVMQGHLQQNIDSLELSRLLIKVSGLDHCFLTSSGVMANENALKIAFQHRHPASRILAFEKCFMGRTLTISQLTDKPAYRDGLPMNALVDYIPFYEWEDPEGSTRRAIESLKTFLTRYPGQHAAMCLELVQGEGGFYPGTRDFFIPILELLREHQITVIMDEVQTFGRTPSLFAYMHYGLEEFTDIVTIGKLSQACATLFRKEIKPRPGLLSQTFTSGTAAIRTGRFIIESLVEGGYYGTSGKITTVHKHFVQNFTEIEQRHPNLIRGPYGIGAMIAFTPLEGKFKRVVQFIQKLFHAGVISFIAGDKPSRVRFLVPIGAITPDDINQVTKIVESVLVECSQDPETT
jgi:acetylornithine/N-succinyldiaminopimelate aminotransferase